MWLTGEPLRPTNRANKITVDGNGVKVYKCEKCPKSFKHPLSISQHVKIHSGETKCTICYKILSRVHDLKLHLATVHGIKKWRSISYLCYYAESYHESVLEFPDGDLVKFRCHVCWKGFKHPTSLTLHKDSHIGKTQCPICSRTFSRSYDMRNHLVKIHQEQVSTTSKVRTTKTGTDVILNQ